jgi:hypothetical protein
MNFDRLRRAVEADLGRGRDERQAHDAATQEKARLAAEREAGQTLEQRAASYVRRGWTVESHLPGQVVLTYGKPVNHVLHLLLSVLTLGLWLIAWIILAATGGPRRLVLTEDDAGRVIESKR